MHANAEAFDVNFLIRTIGSHDENEKKNYRNSLLKCSRRKKFDDENKC